MAGSLLATVTNGFTPLQEGALAALGILFFLVPLVLVVVQLAGMWKVFEKAGEPGWAAIVPIYNLYVLLGIVGRPVWWLVLFLIPLVNLVVTILVMIDVAKAFDKGVGYALGLILLPVVFWPLLGFGDARYRGAPN